MSDSGADMLRLLGEDLRFYYMLYVGVIATMVAGSVLWCYLRMRSKRRLAGELAHREVFCFRGYASCSLIAFSIALYVGIDARFWDIQQWSAVFPLIPGIIQLIGLCFLVPIIARVWPRVWRRRWRELRKDPSPEAWDLRRDYWFALMQPLLAFNVFGAMVHFAATAWILLELADVVLATSQ